jgi:hypothetical protein
MWNVILLILMQDRCTLCAKHTTGSEIVLNAPDVNPRRVGSSGISFWSCLEIVLVSKQDRDMVCAKRTIGLEIVLDASNDAAW